jgi:hypothetical protein
MHDSGTLQQSGDFRKGKIFTSGGHLDSDPMAATATQEILVVLACVDMKAAAGFLLLRVC